MNRSSVLKLVEHAIHLQNNNHEALADEQASLIDDF